MTIINNSFAVNDNDYIIWKYHFYVEKYTINEKNFPATL